ncbi:MAG: phytanoyl-CoA dioxygenase family protein [Arcobacter sp.]|nr:phytanoyl-CoA dioxygenase family protein [Arcobacter sp.]
MELTQEQLNEFNKNGFLVIKNFAEKKLCNDILAKAKVHLKNKQAPIESEQEYVKINSDEQTVRRLKQVYDREEIFKDWMINKKIRPMLRQILNDTPVLTLAHHNSIMTKIPNDSTRTFWHQDRRYWHFENDNLVSVWLSLEDEFLNNGLLEFIPKSHKIKFSEKSFDKDFNFIDNYKENKKLILSKVHQNLEKGDIVLFHCKTLHHANKNISEKTKISFVYTVRAMSNKPLKNTRSDFKEVILD